VNPSEIIVPAVINGALTLLVFLGSRKNLRLGGGLLVVVTLAYGWLIWSPNNNAVVHSTADIAWTNAEIVGTVWLPGSIVAAVAGRLSPRFQLPFGIGAVCLGAVLGAGAVFIALAAVCTNLGECL
jgi:hypothetical protein